VPYSACGPPEFRDAIGTSFAAPQVSAAAALLLGADPNLTADQIGWLLERSARDLNPTTGCPNCRPGRDSLTGWGRLDIEQALVMARNTAELPKPDPFEPNDEAGDSARPFGPPRTISASLDYWDDPLDVYSITLARGRHLFVRLSPSASHAVSLELWKPGTVRVEGPAASAANRVAKAVAVGKQLRLSYVVPKTGKYYLEVEFVPPARARITYALALSTKAS
jgi:hypothetical protein